MMLKNNIKKILLMVCLLCSWEVHSFSEVACDNFINDYAKFTKKAMKINLNYPLNLASLPLLFFIYLLFYDNEKNETSRSL